MSTTALCSTQQVPNNINSIMPREKDTRTIVREEIQRAKALEQLEQKHEAGEISDFEYKVQKFMLTTVDFLPTPEKVGRVYSTTA